MRAVAVSAWWLACEHELWSAVAAEGGRVVGHVALHPPDEVAVPRWRAATGRDAEGMAMVSRLFTDRSVRGAGTALLQEAVEQAARTGRTAVLQVDPEAPALGFYRRRGWREAGCVRQQWGHRVVDAVLLVAP